MKEVAKKNLKKYENKYNGTSLPVFCEYNDDFNYLLTSEVIYQNNTKCEELLPYDNFINVAEELTVNSLYYPYNTMISTVDTNGNQKSHLNHSHAHDFEQVVLDVYHNPNYFSINQEDYEYYSKQQLDFLFRLQNFLKLVKKPDNINSNNENTNAFNELAKEYRKYKMKTLKDDKLVENLLNGKRPYFIYPKTDHYRSSINDKYLICDKNNKYIAIAKITAEKEFEIAKLTSTIIDYKVENMSSLDELKEILTNEFKKYTSFNGNIIICYIELLETFN